MIINYPTINNMGESYGQYKGINNAILLASF